MFLDGIEPSKYVPTRNHPCLVLSGAECLQVRRTLRQSAALEHFWHRPVTSEMLQRELERMASQSKMPDRLRELFAALGDDPFLIQECLARPALTARLLENYVAFDDRKIPGTRGPRAVIRRIRKARNPGYARMVRWS